MMKRLYREDDGAIIVMGVFACAFLIGAMWYLLGVGDALLFKERMQDGADAVAFAPSVVHARGMNLIALLNLTMAAVLSVLVAAKITQTLLLAAVASACDDIYNPDCEDLAGKVSGYNDFVQRVENTTSKINRSLHDTAVTVARTIPQLAARRGAAAGRDYAPMVEGSFAASISLVSGDSERSFGGQLVDSSGQGGGQGGGQGSGQGKRYGLPVEDDDYSNLCHHSGTLIEVLFMPTILHYDEGSQLVMKIMEYAGELAPALVMASPDQFCSSGGGGGGGGGSSQAVSLKIYGPAKHGNDYFATWGFTQSHFIEDDKRGEKGIGVATWQKDVAGTQLSSAELDKRMREVQIAKSEFYYDPRGGSRDWSTIKDEGLWNLRWRARLRRANMPNRSLARFFTGPGLSAITKEASGGDAAGVVKTVLGASPDQLASWAEQNLQKLDQTRRNGGIVH